MKDRIGYLCVCFLAMLVLSAMRVLFRVGAKGKAMKISVHLRSNTSELDDPNGMVPKGELHSGND